MKFQSFWLFGVLTLATAAPAAAQRDVARRAFTFLDDNVTVEVQADAPGTLQIVRGEAGRLEAVGRVPGGLATFALGGRTADKLRLTAVGGEKADFIVVVPEEAYVRVVLPNRKQGSLTSTRSGGAYTWGGADLMKSSVSLAMPPAGPTVAHSAPHAPRTLSIPRLTTVRTVSLRIQGSSFEVGGNHHMSVSNGSSQSVEVRTGSEPEELIITIPSDTRDFTLKLGGRTALVMRGYEVSSYCEPVTEQILSGGRWFTYAPEAGRLTCR